MEVSWTFVLWVVVLLLLFHYFIFKPFLHGKLPIPLAKWVGRAVHYPKLPFVIDEDVYLGCLPTFWNQHLLSDLRVRAVVNMCDEAYGPAAFYKESGIEQLYLPTVDHIEPTVEDMKTAVQFIDHNVQQGKKVLIHCMAGRGRSAAVAMAWLLYRFRQLDLDTAQQLLLSKRAMVRAKLNKQRNLIAYHSELSSQRAKLVN
ncbi:dual specificity phosphatase, catalytic domain containing protein [Acanthamoeba castellanii str. Neff]|uniref:Dual specificity phosphatase, catalytic domain containing protein n=1 Tax=Acanthamoeba castellanii (strain ATCC 30010 / Neff) TaxID=1257118 RepID=L8H1W0_ACACF|nr:dual specificity phosphatase, catalytic domain containing protein [Acanthamoeba castellanii str. Neff]ELR19225.1 dual specificity phosphatase, catalytic domain containing protein [Acanthamoeba castellanii str. Neff]